MPGLAAPVARQAPTSAGPSNGRREAPPTPFPIASLKRVRQAFDTGSLALGQTASAIEIPAAGGYLRYIELDVTGTAASNVATVVFQPDAPFSALSFIEFMPPSGDPPIVPHTGYQLHLWNKHGAFSQRPPYSDPRRHRKFSATAGAGGTGGSFRFILRLPFELDPTSGFGSITNSAANKSYLLTITIAASAAIYSTAPTNAPTVRILGWMYYWDEPAAQTRAGTRQMTGPLGLGSFSQLRLEQPPVTAGDKIIKVNNAGPVLRFLQVVLRTSASARVLNTATTDIPATWNFMFNTRDRWLLSDDELCEDMAEATGYGLALSGTWVAPTMPTDDGPLGLDHGVRFFPYFLDFAGISPMNPRSQLQVTGDATLTQIRGTSFGANVATMEILSNLVRPASSAALYPPNRIY
jgi:hypothetical protein